MKLFSIENLKSSNHIECLNGIRVMTAIWIVCAHTIMFFTNVPTQNPAAMFKVHKFDMHQSNKNSVVNIGRVVGAHKTMAFFITAHIS